jgi:hypothetical protein
MKRLLYGIVVGLFAASSSFGQTIGPLRTGFAVVTPITGGVSAFSVSETFIQVVNGTVFQSSVPPSPLVTLTSMTVNSDPASGVNTGIAIVDPFDLAATVALTLVDGAQQQRSQFLTELFLGLPELTTSFTGQLFFSSNVPVSILGLAFTGSFFAALPPATQLNTMNVFSVIRVNDDARATTAGIIDQFGTANVLVFPQVAAGGGWTTKITIANVSRLPQSVQVDFLLGLVFPIPSFSPAPS